MRSSSNRFTCSSLSEEPTCRTLSVVNHNLIKLIALPLLLAPLTVAASPGDVLRAVPMPTSSPHHATYPLGLGFDGEHLYIANIGEAKNPASPFVVFQLDAESGDIVHSVKMGNEGDDFIRSSVVAANKSLFIRTNDKLYCLGK